jgi:hypothetical protein
MTERERIERLILSNSDVLLLFDEGEAENVCRLLIDSPAPLADSLGPLVIEPLTKIINATEGHSAVRHAAVAMRNHIEILERLIKMNPASAGEFADKLRMLWLTFIVAVSASRIYHDLPKSRVQKRNAAKRPRPSAASPLADAIRSAMGRARAKKSTFKEFMSAWEADQINGLRLTDLRTKKYSVDDENGDLGSGEYTWGTLSKMYSS